MSTSSSSRVRSAVMSLAFAVLLVVPSSIASASGSLSASLFCLSVGHARFEAQLTITGGTSPYSTAWTPGAGANGFQFTSTDTAIVNCFRPYTEAAVTATVTDSDGNSAVASCHAFCGDAQ